ncbi:CAP domain-containing protein [Chitinophaga sp. SYP-B3965]|uniref:CAP domain-containing protein n=1 Tax=Chitinophaga sp. SYP-B3965 TaxID=2663120 RepID=UPI001299C34A|nr:CAP domain-containing protein [Chitinophaga sp. SYP-B3965]MRG43998.1 CAP domain-containing protein [Chitinophaga sp. SYP-B3965]
MLNQHFFKILILSAAVIVATQASACSKSVSGNTSSSSSGSVRNSGDEEQDILFYVNKFRKSKGLAPLSLSETLSVEARGHSKSMANGRTGFGHDGFEQRIDGISKKLGRVSAAAENVAYGNLSAEAVVDGWIKSPGHRKNMLGDFNLIGIGTAKGKGNIVYFTQIFISKPSDKTASK